ncbi:MAG: hypothetical protein HOP19_16520 [Acidobacteria bacterium]|nr:hypothetical protein [Acidobacteriota bacterium]
MLSHQTRVQSRRAVRQPYPPMPAPGGATEVIIPYDHAAAFELTGRPGNILQDVINVGSDGTFVAVAMGYGFEPLRGKPIGSAVIAAAVPVDVRTLRLSQLPLGALIEGVRFNPKFAEQIADRQPFAPAFIGDNIIERITPAADISFFFSMVDSSTGREFQDQPAHNLASLGQSNGARPFRLLARPLTFQPRSTLRLQIAERSAGTQGTLFIVLYGYKVLSNGCVEPTARRWQPAAHGEPDARAIPFDYVTTFALTGRSGNILEDEISINASDEFIATSIGYGLATEGRDVKLNLPGNPINIDLGTVTLDAFPPEALLDGIKIRPNFLRAALGGNAGLANPLPVTLADQIFERLNRPEDVAFRYEIFDSGTGRELQNRPINNVAGLGIATGERPFKKLARPISFLPRSTIRVKVEERFGRGTLFIAFQGYKLIGSTTGGHR